MRKVLISNRTMSGQHVLNVGKLLSVAIACTVPISLLGPYTRSCSHVSVLHTACPGKPQLAPNSPSYPKGTLTDQQ